MQILLVLQRDADRALERVRPARAALVKERRGFGPVDGFGDSGRLAQRLAPKLTDSGDDGAGRGFGFPSGPVSSF